MGGTCSACGRRKMHTGVWWKNLQKKYYLEGLDVNMMIIIKWILKK